MVTFKYLPYFYLFICIIMFRFFVFFNNENENISPPPTNAFIFWTFVAVASSLCPPSAASCARSKLTTLKLRALIGSRCRLRPWTGPARVTSKETWHTDWPEERCSCACGRSLCDSERVFFNYYYLLWSSPVRRSWKPGSKVSECRFLPLRPG